MRMMQILSPSTRLLRGAFLVYAFLLGPVCLAQALTLSGTIGKAPVVLEVSIADGTAYGRYFYRRHHEDIPIDGSVRADGALELAEGATRNTTATAIMLLRPVAAGVWHGTWRDVKGHKTLAVALSERAPHSTTRNFPSDTATVPTISVYERERLLGLPLQADGMESISGRNLEWWLEPVSGVRVFRVVNGYPAAVLARLNEWLSVKQNEAIAYYFSCNFEHFKQYGPVERSDFRFDERPRFLSDQFVSVTVRTAGECGNSMVVMTHSALNFHVRTMRELEITDLLWAGSVDVDHGQADFASWLESALGKLYPDDMADLKERCRYKDAEVWSAPSWFMTAEGISLSPSFSAHKQGPCGDEWFLPWSFIKQHPGKLATNATETGEGIAAAPGVMTSIGHIEQSGPIPIAFVCAKKFDRKSK